MTVILAEGNNELNVSLVPVAPPVAPFTFSNAWAELVDCISAPAWKTMNYGCRITNPGSQTLTKTLKVMWHYYETANPANSYSAELTRFSLTLTPGQIYDFTFYGNINEENAWLVISTQTTHCIWLEDLDGNKSPVLCVHR